MKVNLLKNIMSWGGWALKEYPLITIIIYLSGAVLVALFIFLPNILSTALSIRIILGGLGALIVIMFLISTTNVNKNFRAAILEAERFKKEYPGFDNKIDGFITQVQQNKDPSKMNKWIEDYKKLQKAEKELEILKNKLTSEVPGQITEKGLEIIELKRKIS